MKAGWIGSYAIVMGLLAFWIQPVAASPDYSGCESCHGTFNEGDYISQHDGTAWGTHLMEGHQPSVDNKCMACHLREAPSPVFTNFSDDGTFEKSCVGCHGRQEDVTGNCTGLATDPRSEVHCGAGAGLRLHHERQVGQGTCSQCHDKDPTPAPERRLPSNYLETISAIADSCNSDGSEARFGATGLDNDGDGLRDQDDSDCQFFLNAGLNDAWFNPATPGQGFLLTVLEETGIVFLAWFTYDVSEPTAGASAVIGDPGHRWLTAQGPFDGDTAALDVFLSAGGRFDAADPAVGPPTQSGTLTVQWDSCGAATVHYDLEGAAPGVIPIQRLTEDNTPLCEMLIDAQ